MHRIMQTLHEDHINVTRLLDLMESIFSDVRAGSPAAVGTLHGAMQYMTAYPDLYHHPTEDVVFQRLIARAPETRARVAQLFDEHEVIGSAGINLRQKLTMIVEQSAEPPPELVIFGQNYVSRLREHMNIEEGEIFPLAKVILSERDWQRLDETIAAARDPLFGTQVQKSFQDLARALTKV